MFNNSGGRHWIPKWLLQEGQNCFICEKNGHLKPDCPFLSEFIRTGLKRCYDCKVMHTPRDYCQPKHGPTPPEGHRYGQNFNKSSNKITYGCNKYGSRGGSRGMGGGSLKGVQKYRSGPQNQRGKYKFVNANLAGENSLTNPTSNSKYTKNIHFIADSGASEHIISNKGLILEEFTKTPGKIIKSANKNNFADIKNRRQNEFDALFKCR